METNDLTDVVNSSFILNVGQEMAEEFERKLKLSKKQNHILREENKRFRSMI